MRPVSLFPCLIAVLGLACGDAGSSDGEATEAATLGPEARVRITLVNVPCAIQPGADGKCADGLDLRTSVAQWKGGGGIPFKLEPMHTSCGLPKAGVAQTWVTSDSRYNADHKLGIRVERGRYHGSQGDDFCNGDGWTNKVRLLDARVDLTDFSLDEALTCDVAAGTCERK